MGQTIKARQRNAAVLLTNTGRYSGPEMMIYRRAASEIPGSYYRVIPDWLTQKR